jgi:hypothetical protein
MPLNLHMLHAVVRIIGDVTDKKTGRTHRKPIGTGFYMRVESEAHPDHWYGYVLTAHHVVDAQERPGLIFPDWYKPGGLYPEIESEGADWQHPIEDLDLAVLRFSRPSGYYINALHLGTHLLEHLPADQMLARTFHYVGLLEPLNRAMARTGTLGAIYEQGIEHKDGYRYEAHLGDCRSYGGFSGSPCFVEIETPHLTPVDHSFSLPVPDDQPVGLMGYLHLLCGMVTWHLESAVPREEASLFGVVTILTSDEIWRALMSDEMIEQRRQADQIDPEPTAKQVNLSIGGGGNQEFERFEDLTEKLLRVPKKALDEKRTEQG